MGHWQQIGEDNRRARAAGHRDRRSVLAAVIAASALLWAGYLLLIWRSLAALLG